MRRLFLWLMLSLMAAPGTGQESSMLFRSYGLRDGLPAHGIIDIVQDTSDFLWIATELGLARFDGLNFNSYYFSATDTFSLSSNIVRELFRSSRGDLWVGTWNGLSRYDPVYDRFDRFVPNQNLPQGDQLNVVRAIDESTDGTIFFLVEGGCLYSIGQGKIRNRLSLQRGDCKMMTIDEQDQCWIASGNQIFRFDIPGNLTTRYEISYPSSVNNPEVTDMLRNDSLLYISSYNYDLVALDVRSGEQRVYDLVEDMKHTTSLMMDGNELYVGTSDGICVAELTTNRIRSYRHDDLDENSLSSDAVTKIFLDNHENLWVGTAADLNVAYRNKGFYTFTDCAADVDVTAILQDHQGNTWIGYSRGFQVFGPAGRTVPDFSGMDRIEPSPEIGSVFCISESDRGIIWMGTYINGLLRFDPAAGNVSQYYPGRGSYDIPGTDIRDIEEDILGNIWIAIHGYGIFVLPAGSETFVPVTGFIPGVNGDLNQQWPFDIEFDNRNNLWIGSSLGASCYDFKTGEFRHFDQSPASDLFLSSIGILSVFVDSRDYIWLGTHHGINLISPDLQQLKVFNRQDGLPNADIQAINEDSENVIWISTNYGISRMEPLGGFNFSITNYDRNHGLNTNDFNSKSTFSDDRFLYFGGAQGYTYFDPLKVSYDSLPPRVVFTDLYVFDRKVSIGSNPGPGEDDGLYLDKHIRFTDRVRIEQKFSMIGFEFIAITYINPERSQYQYMLEGFDHVWRDLGNRNILYFNNLKPGTYTLRVKGSNSYGIWNPEPAEVELTIIPPLWKSKAALVFYFILVLSISLYLINISVQKEKMRLEVEHQNKLRDLRTRFFMNVSHELKTPLTLISLPLKRMILRYREFNTLPSLEDLNMISRNVIRLTRIMNQIFDLRRIELNKADIRVSRAGIVEFTRAMLEYFDYQLKKKSITVQTHFPEKEILCWFDPDKMDKIMFNLLSNALKYTPDGGRIEIAIEMHTVTARRDKTQERVRWTITDNGQGIRESYLKNIFDRYSYSGSFSEEHQGGTGIGLSIVKEFVKMHHGEVTIHSKAKADGHDDSYVRVEIGFPCDKSLYSEEQIDQGTGDVARIREELGYITSIGEDRELLTEAPFSTREEECEYKVLVIDDEMEICNLLKKELSISYSVIIANDGKEGFELAVDTHPDIIISDVIMPGMDGYELCRQLKTRLETSHIPIILLTGKSGEDDEIQGYLTGADAFISKPFDMESLMSRMEMLITNRLRLKQAFLSSYGIELKKVVPTNTDEKFIKDLISFIQANISDHGLNVDRIARELGVSRSLLYKKLSYIANTSVKIFIRKIRLQKATELLREGSLTITEIAYATGFDSLPYFSKCFHEEYGISPSKYASS